MKKHFGENYFLAMHFFNVAHERDFNQLLMNEPFFRKQTPARTFAYIT